MLKGCGHAVPALFYQPKKPPKAMRGYTSPWCDPCRNLAGSDDNLKFKNQCSVVASVIRFQFCSYNTGEEFPDVRDWYGQVLQ